MKTKGKEAEDSRRHARQSSIEIGDTVLAARTGNVGKLDTPYQTIEYDVIDRQGPSVTIQDTDSGGVYKRNVAHLKKVVPKANSDSTGQSSIATDVEVSSGMARVARSHKSICFKNFNFSTESDRFWVKINLFLY